MSAPCPTLAFAVSVRLNVDEASAEVRQLLRELADVFDHNDLIAVRTQGHSTGREYIVRRDGSQATEQDRALVREWGERWADSATVDVGDIIDIGTD